MTRKLGLILGMAGMLALVGACSDDSGTTPGKKDGSTNNKDGGAIYLDQGGNTQKDTGGTPQQDQGGAADQNCTEVLQCAAKCSDATCQAACVAKGSADAQTKFNALVTCMNTAQQGSCASACSNPQDPGCASCVQAACKAENDACLGGGGPPEAGFGDECNQQKQCNSGFECILMGQNATNGFCTKTCTNQGGKCSGAPTGSESYCALTDQGQTKFYCAFVCKISGQTYTCPGNMACGTENQGQAFCEPQ